MLFTMSTYTDYFMFTFKTRGRLARYRLATQGLKIPNNQAKLYIENAFNGMYLNEF